MPPLPLPGTEHAGMNQVSYSSSQVGGLDEVSWVSTWPGISAWSLLLWKIVLFVAVIREQVCDSDPLCGFRSAWSGFLRPFASSKTKLHG
jgi:hypothetical protein